MARTSPNGRNGADHNDQPVNYTPQERVSGESIKEQIKLMIFKDPGIPTKDIMDKLSKRNVAPSKFTVEGIRADTRNTLKLLNRRGMLSKDIKI